MKIITTKFWACGRLCRFVKEVYDDNTEAYFVNGEPVEKDKGNKMYVEYRANKKEDAKIEVTTEVMTYEQKIEDLMKGYDEYFEYIDNYRQYQQAKDSNAKILAQVDVLKDLIAKRDAK